MTVEAGSCVSLIGRNGVGKTTLLNCVMGLLRVDSGIPCSFDGSDLARLPAEHRALIAGGICTSGTDDLSFTDG